MSETEREKKPDFQNAVEDVIELTFQDSQGIADLVEKCTALAAGQFKEVLQAQLRNAKYNDPRQ